MDDGVTGDAPGCIWLARITDDDAVSVITSSQRQVTLTEFILTTTGAGPFAEQDRNLGLFVPCGRLPLAEIVEELGFGCTADIRTLTGKVAC